MRHRRIFLFFFFVSLTPISSLDCCIIACIYGEWGQGFFLLALKTLLYISLSPCSVLDIGTARRGAGCIILFHYFALPGTFRYLFPFDLEFGLRMIDHPPTFA
jgi:hypothetical protein